MKRILSVQDISCVGKCSLTVALPIISAMGVETGILPTALLSVHTMFEHYTFLDLTDEMPKISEAWKQEMLDFDAIYTGYLGSVRQMNIVQKVFEDYKKEDGLILIDPVLGDNGKLYKGFDQAFADEMAKLCSKADVILPNMTEASYMLHIPYVKEDYDEAYVRDVLKKLSEIGAKNAAITGISFEEDKIGIMAYDAEHDRYFSYFNRKIESFFHGTGDIFASTVMGALMNGFDLEESLRVAVDYTLECIRLTTENPNRRIYGVDFEDAIPYLIDRIGKTQCQNRKGGI